MSPGHLVYFVICTILMIAVLAATVTGAMVWHWWDALVVGGGWALGSLLGYWLKREER